MVLAPSTRYPLHVSHVHTVNITHAGVTECSIDASNATAVYSPDTDYYLESETPMVVLTKADLYWLGSRLAYLFSYVVHLFLCWPVFQRGISGRVALARVWRAERYLLLAGPAVYWFVEWPLVNIAWPGQRNFIPFTTNERSDLWDLAFLAMFVQAILLYKRSERRRIPTPRPIPEPEPHGGLQCAEECVLESVPSQIVTASTG